ncbi:class I SAM-dependent methyltransferase [Microbispora sp. NPDC049125]|uniref:class I SAM-dependent methyltransferase n=1 Tax=Microbispora sp. NPDC049125 TaxID=3154929 RepID=UPI003466BFB3
MTSQTPNQGTGPGPITPDGCAVDYYAQLTPMGEPEIVHAAIPAGASILELGAGAGRITRPLLAFGHEVVAVDESPEMLAHIEGAETVCSPIETLALERVFDVVLLMSFVIDVADEEMCRAFLRTCRRHVADSGAVLLQRKPAEWHDSIEPFEKDAGGGRVARMIEINRPEPDILAATMEYVVGDRRWTHHFVSRRRDDARLAELLGEAGLEMAGFLTGDREWVRALPRRPS